MPRIKQHKYLWSGIAIAIISVIALAVFGIQSTTKPDIPSVIKTTPPDSLRAYALKPNLLKLHDEWNTLRNADDPDSLHSLVKNNYVDTQYIGLRLLEQATLFRDRGKEEIANAKLKTAREIGQDLVEVFQDSFLLKQVEHVEKLDDKQLRLRAKASEAYASACEPFYDGKYAEAEPKFEVARKLAEKANDDKLSIEAMSLLQWFQVRYNGNYQAGIDLGKQIVAKAEHTGYKRRLGIAFHYMADAFRELDRDEDAIINYRKAIQIAKHINDRITLGNIYQAQAEIYYRMEDYQNAESIINELINIDKEGRYDRHVSRIQGKIFFERGEYGKAKQKYEQALKKFRERKDNLNVAIILNLLSRLHFRMGDFEYALKLETEALGLKKLENNMKFIALSLSNIGRIYQSMGDFNKALTSYDDALRYFPSGSKRHKRDLLLQIGQIQFKKGDLDVAEKTFTKAEKISKSLNAKAGLAEALMGYGFIALEKAKFDRTFDHLNSALNIGNELNDPRLKANAYFGLSKVENALHNYENAMYFINQAILANETRRRAIIEDSLRISFFATAQELFDEAILLSIGQGKSDLALHFAERSQARALLDAWSNTLIKELGTNDSNLLDTTIPSLKILQNNIPPHVQVLEYRLTPDTLLIWLIDNQRLLMEKTPISSQELENKVQNFLESIGAKHVLNFKARVKKDIAAVYNENRLLGNQLYQLLIKPVYRELASDKQVVIIPHGFLHQVPFGALVTDEGHFLDERFVLSKAPSLAILNKSLNWQNPEVEAANLQFLMIAGDFPSTPSQKEMAKRLFTNAIILEKESANYDAIKTRLNEGAKILYLNVHAVSDPHHPMNSFIELLGNNPATGHQNRTKIYGRQLLELNLSSTWLAVLNGCETALGRIAQGEGVLNIVRIFSLAKVAFVTASLWKNDDYWSAEIMEKFFEDIAHGKDTAESLRHAKLYAMKKFKAEYQFPLPYFWTVFELYQNSWLNQQELFSYK